MAIDLNLKADLLSESSLEFTAPSSKKPMDEVISGSEDDKNGKVESNQFPDETDQLSNRSDKKTEKDEARTTNHNTSIKKESNVSSSNYKKLVDDYNKRFIELKELQQQRLEQLILEGIEDYNNNKGNVITLLRLSNRYLAKANELEKQSDSEFDDLLSEFKDDLEANSFDTDIIRQLEQYYDEYKKQLRSNLLQKAKQHL